MVSAFAIRGIGIVSAIITTPLTLGYLGASRFGLWMTITSITALLSFADFGVGSGLLNEVSRADGQGDKVGALKAVSSAFLVLTIIALMLTAIFSLAYAWLAWGVIFNLSNEVEIDEVRNAVAILLACIAMSLPLSVVVRVQMGYQEGLENNLWQAAANFVAMIGVVCAALLEANLPWLVLASSGGPVLVLFINWIHQFGFHRRWLLPRVSECEYKVARRILKAGGYFAALQLLAFIGFFSDNFIITLILGSAAVAGYAIVFKLFSAIFVVQFLMAPLWPALNEAITRGELQEARQLFERASQYCLVAGCTIAGFLVVFGRPVIALWVGESYVPEWILIAGFAAWSIVASYYATISALLSGGFLNQQLRLIGAAATISLILKFSMVGWIGVSGAIWAAVTGYGLLIIVARSLARRALGYL